MITEKKKKRGRSVQDLIGIKTFTRYGLQTNRGELVFFSVAPTNISVLSHANIENKIRQLMSVLSMIPDIEVICTDSSECFDDNKAYLRERYEIERNPKLKEVLEKDIVFIDHMQTEMSTARQFMFVVRLKLKKDRQVFDAVNDIEKNISSQGFEVRRMKKPDIKRILALYFDASMSGEHMPDYDGEQYGLIPDTSVEVS